MEITITWPLAIFILGSIAILLSAWAEDKNSSGMFQGCLTAMAIAFVIFLWVLYGGIYWW